MSEQCGWRAPEIGYRLGRCLRSFGPEPLVDQAAVGHPLAEDRKLALPGQEVAGERQGVWQGKERCLDAVAVGAEHRQAGVYGAARRSAHVVEQNGWLAVTHNGEA